MFKNRIGIAVGVVVLIAVLVTISAVIQNISVERRYQTAFDETKPGETLNSVLLRFGEPYDVAGRMQPGDTVRQPSCKNECWLRLWYMSPILGGLAPYSIDFGSDQKVIGKYRWASP
jgi:hypothetical protein